MQAAAQAVCRAAGDYGFDCELMGLHGTDLDRLLGRLRADPPDLVFLDMNIPGSSGAEVLMQIKADPATDGVKVIIVTADGEEGRERAIGMGADEYFTKPFSPITLLQTVERVLSSPPPAG